VDVQESLEQVRALLDAAAQSKDLDVMRKNIAMAHDLTLRALSEVMASRIKKP
jgi:hypothetical protein